MKLRGLLTGLSTIGIAAGLTVVGAATPASAEPRGYYERYGLHGAGAFYNHTGNTDVCIWVNKSLWPDGEMRVGPEITHLGNALDFHGAYYIGLPDGRGGC